MQTTPEFKTTFYEDFSIADAIGEEAIRDTFKRAFEEWKNDYRYLTDLVMTLNHKLWEHWAMDEDSPIALLYNELWEEADDYACDNLKGEELQYFLEVTD